VIIRVMEPWRLAQGDTSLSRRSIQRLRSLARNAPNDALNSEIEIAFLEMLHADAIGSPSLRASVARLDSLLLLGEAASMPTSRYAQHTIFGARIWEKLGDLPRAAAMAGRYAVWATESVPYLALQLREQGRIASLAGDRKRATRTYQHYLGMRADAEPAAKAQVDSVRRELARLTGAR
jgi:hypothetical protein